MKRKRLLFALTILLLLAGIAGAAAITLMPEYGYVEVVVATMAILPVTGWLLFRYGVMEAPAQAVPPEQAYSADAPILGPPLLPLLSQINWLFRGVLGAALLRLVDIAS